MPLYTPPQLAKLLQVNPSTIKRWVDKGYLQATVTKGGHRRISTKNVNAFIRSYPEHARNSYRIGQWLRERDNKKTDSWKEYYAAVDSGDYTESVQYVEKYYASGYTALEICEQVIAPTLEHIGALWAEKTISVFDEHRMTFLIRRHLEHLLTLTATPIEDNKTAILACIPGEQHELPLLMVQIILAQYGWNVAHLGINTPLTELRNAIQTLKPTLVCISKQYRQNNSLSYLQTVYSVLPPGSKMIIGGQWKKNEIAYAQRMHKSAYVSSLSAFDTSIHAM